MLKETVEAAEAEAHRFLKRAEEWKKRLRTDATVTYCGTREGGALRCASLDLTRALAKMRQP